MKRTVFTFGIISGAILSVMMLATLPFMETIGFDRGEIIGYTSMILAFLLIFFGIKSYRDNVAGGSVSFGRAFAVGALIAVVASTLYVATWQVIYHKLAPDFTEKYQAYVLERERASGASEVELAAKRVELAEFAEWYKNPFVNVAITFLEPMPVALIIALVSAGILRRRRGDGVPAEKVAEGR